MSAAVDSVVDPSDPSHLTVLYSTNEDGWVTAQIAEFPAAISQGRTQHEAWTNVLDALHDLTHQPTSSERLASALQTWLVEPLSEIIDAAGDALRGIAEAAREHGRHPVH